MRNLLFFVWMGSGRGGMDRALTKGGLAVKTASLVVGAQRKRPPLRARLIAR